MKNKKIMCFGEVLWDMLPSGKEPGGAPFNVAFHLNNLGFDTAMISKIGTDDLGKEMWEYLNNTGLEAKYIQQGTTHLTGVAKANISDSSEVTYKIVHPVAWDYIQLSEELIDSVSNSSCFVYGTLGARSEVSRYTLNELLKNAKFKVYDVNLRAPFYSKESVESLLYKADMVKMNEHELALISGWFKLSEDLNDSIKELAKVFNLQIICISKGKEGALLFRNNSFTKCSSFNVEVVDTIGSGDAFLAALIKNMLEDNESSESLAFACATGSLVSTFKGATPKITESDIRSFLESGSGRVSN